MPIVHLLCGLNGAGKTHYAKTLPATRFSLDEYMIGSGAPRFDDPAYPELARVGQEALWRMALAELRAGRSVVLDWNLWSRDRRWQWSQRAAGAGYDVLLHYIRVPLAIAVQRSLDRRDGRSFALTSAEVQHLAAIFQEPRADEGIPLMVVSNSVGSVPNPAE